MSSHQQWLQERQQLLLQNPSFFIVFLTPYSTKEEVPSHICWLQRKKDSHSQYYAIQTLSFHKLTTHYDYFWMQSSFRMKEDLWLVLEAAETQMPVTVQLYNPIPVYIWNRTDWYVWVVQYLYLCLCRNSPGITVCVSVCVRLTAFESKNVKVSMYGNKTVWGVRHQISSAPLCRQGDLDMCWPFHSCRHICLID